MTRPLRIVIAGAAAVAAASFAAWPVAAAPSEYELVSVSTNGKQADLDSRTTATSQDGRFVVFYSAATSLVPDDPSFDDVFIRDRTARTTRRVSVPAPGAGPVNGYSRSADVSDDGRYVAFGSDASNLVPADANGKYSDVFVRDLESGSTEIVSVTSGGEQLAAASGSPRLTPDGRYVVFHSTGRLAPQDINDVPDVYVRDRLMGSTELVSVPGEDETTSDNPDLLGDLLGGDDDGSEGVDAFSGFADISDDGRVIAFESRSTRFDAEDRTDELDIYVRDRSARTTERVSVSSAGDSATGWSSSASINGDGTVVAFESAASNLVPGGVQGRTDVYVRHLGATPTTERVSVSSGGDSGSGWSRRPSLDRDGRYVAFETTSALSADDLNRWNDVYVRDLASRTTTRMSGDLDRGNGVSLMAKASSSGVAFDSTSTDLAHRDTNGRADVLYREFRPKK